MNHIDGIKAAREASHFGLCHRRKIGAVLVKAGEIVAAAWNGPMNGACECPGRDKAAGTGGAACYGIHAEQRALARYGSPDFDTVYCTKAPCTACTLVLLGTDCKEIVFEIASNETENMQHWLSAGRKWTHYQEAQ